MLRNVDLSVYFLSGKSTSFGEYITKPANEKGAPELKKMKDRIAMDKRMEIERVERMYSKKFGMMARSK